MPDQPSSSPALPDTALRETLDLLGQVVANMSERLDQQGEQIKEMAKVVQATRTAAQHAEQLVDPAAYGRFIGEHVEKALDHVLDDFARVVVEIRKDHDRTRARLQELEQAERAMLDRLRLELAEAGRWRRKVPLIWGGTAVLGLLLGVGLTALF